MDFFQDNIIEGRNAVAEALRAGRTLDKVFYAKGENEGAVCSLAMQAKAAGSVAIGVDRRKLDHMSKTGAHQGIIAYAAAREYSEISDIFENAEKSGREPLIVICDEISDPQNLGAIIRSAYAAGAHGVIIPKRRSSGLGAVVSKASAGAIEHIPIVRVPNITATINELKKRGVWIYGTASGAENTIYKTDFTGPVALVIGSEGEGIGRLVAENCDVLLNIPMLGDINSLNASAAAAVVLFEILRQRIG